MELNKDKRFRDTVIDSVGEEILACYQCYKCSAGCPVSFAMDLLPHQVIRAVLFGQKEKVLSSKTIWICATCETCTTRCPNDVDIAELMDILRHMALEAKVELGEKNVPLFHEAFMESIRRDGRVHELSMIAGYKIKSKSFFDDVKLGWEMFKRGKLKLLPQRIKENKEVKKLFKQATEKGDR